MSGWYSVRHVIKNDRAFEERVTLWRAESFDEAIALAREEAERYTALADRWELLDLFQAYWLPADPESGTELFSLIRESDLSGSDYIDQFFATGGELQQEA